MAKVFHLHEDVFRKIAAGEVIERPLSVVKELVENSLDAGAVFIRIELEKGGKEKIRVEDNGEGFDSDDIERAFERHSTSKVRELSDFDHLKTLGFRGEALPSIMEVAKIFLQTSSSDDGHGVEAESDGNGWNEFRSIPFSRGTVIEVRNLFHNFPVRKKFLKSDATELNQITRYMEQIVLAYHDVGFELISNGRRIFSYSAVSLLKERIYQVFGAELVDDLQQVDFRIGEYFMSGFISRIQTGISSRNMQFLTVNQRPVKEKTIFAALNNTYQPFLEKSRYPVAVLHFEIPPREVDVNIHPMKLEIRFQDSQKVYSLVKHAIEQAVSGEGNGIQGDTPSPIPVYAPQGRKSIAHQENLFSGELLIPETRPEDSFILLGQYVQTYIVIEREGNLEVIDQHNARERVIFDSLLEQYRKGEVKGIPTLFPVMVELSPSQKTALTDEWMARALKAGFELNDLGGGAVEIRTFPPFLKEKDVRELFLSLFELPPDEWMQEEKILAQVACKSSVKANQPLHAEEMRTIVRDLFKSSNPRLCPHKRPIIVSFPLWEIEKKLQRR